VSAPSPGARGSSLDELPALPPDPCVSVVIPARGAAHLLPDCLARVLPQLRDDDELIVASGDVATRDAADAIAADDARVRVVDNPDGTTPAALNRAIAAARHPVLVRIDAQARIPDGYRDRVVELLVSTGAVNVGGRQVARAQRGMPAAIAAAMNAPLGHGGASYRSGGRGGPVDTVYLGAFRADALALVGGYDEAFWTNQDAELNERLRRAGGVVWLDPTLEVGYLPRTTLRVLARQFRAYGRGRAATAARHGGSLATRQLAAPALVVALLAALAVLPWTAVPLVAGACGYGALVVIGAAASGADARRRLPLVVAALVTMHLAWGVGFLTGPRAGR
jgi:succinoglycan biosynthesis protein ExoA